MEHIFWSSLPGLAFLAQPDTWILASSSPRRIQLCQSMGWKPIIHPSTFAEDYDHTEFATPADYAIATAKGKVLNVYEELCRKSQRLPKYIVGADTIITLDGKTILEKPKDKADAYKMLTSLSGHWHHCITGLVVLTIAPDQNISTNPNPYGIWTFSQQTDLELDQIPDTILRAYLDNTKEWQDKSGACAYQGMAALYIKNIRGDYYSALGLPVHPLFKRICEKAQS